MSAGNDYTWAEVKESTVAKKWLSQFTSGAGNSMKRVAYLIDTTVWSGFQDNKYAEYAIGGPTVELFTASYNTTHTDRTIETKVDIVANKQNFNGYWLKWSDSTEDDWSSGMNGVDSSNALYIIEEITKAKGMQIASPNSYDWNSMTGSHYNGNLGLIVGGNNTMMGLRPVVALKSGLGVEMQTDGTYKIIDVDPGEAGIKKDSLKYVWRKVSEGTPTVSQITETLVIEGTTETLDEQTSKTIQVQRPISKDTDSGNDWVLWIYAEDTLGNSKIIRSGEFWLDNTSPTVEATPSTVSVSNVCRNKDVTITVTDEHSRLNDTINSYQYYLSTSDTELISEAEGSIFGTPQSLTTFTLAEENDTDARTAVINIGNGETGTRYLFVKAVKDNMGYESIEGGDIVTIEGTNYHRFGPYEFDNLSPKISAFEPETNTTPGRRQSVKVTIEDQGSAGGKTATYKYLWIQSSAEPTAESFDAEYETQVYKGTFKSGGTVTIHTETGNDWYLWVSAEDKLGHRLIDSAGPYYLDNTKPTITATPAENPENSENQNVVKELDVTLTYKDPLYNENVQLAGIRDSTTYTYYLSTSNVGLEGGRIIKVDPAPIGDSYEKQATITIGAGQTGVRYLFVRTINDNAGNESEYTVTSGGSHYQLVGTYTFDNTAPSVSFTPDGDTTTWKLEQITEVTVQDNENVNTGVAGVKTNTIKYRWLQGTSTLTIENFANGEEKPYTTTDDVVETITERISSTEEGKEPKTGEDWYLWIYAEDNLGNANVVRTANPFKLDNARPSVSVLPVSSEVCKSTSVTITAADVGSGFANNPEQFMAYLSESNNNLVNQVEIEYTSGTTIEDVGAGMTGWRYLFVRTVKDKVDLESEQGGNIVTANDGNKYHVYGPYIFDNTAPSVSFNPNGKQEWQKEQGATVTIRENAYGESAEAKADIEEGLDASEITAADYGGYVTNYVAPNGANVGWRIFHTDGDNIYLKADTYIESQYVPTGKGGTPVSASSNKKDQYELSNVTSDYSGLDDINNNKASKLLSMYLESGYTSDAENIKATAYLLDTNQWAGFANKAYAEYAIGGPTIELYADSYNTTHDSTITLAVENKNGYTDYYTDANGESVAHEPYLSEIKSLYITSQNMWIASPDNHWATGVIQTWPTGLFEGHTTSYGSFFPVVALRSNVQLEKQVDGTYRIVENPGEAGVGINEGALKYVWRKESQGKPTVDEITEILVNEETSIVQDEQTSKTIQVQRPISKDTDSGNNWVLWIYAEDTLGNSEIVRSGAFWLDNTAPTVKVTPSKASAASENIDVTITLTDQHSELDDENNSYQYYLSTRNNALVSEEEGSIFGSPQSLTTFTLTETNNNGEKTATINIGNGETGTRYLFVKAVKDNVGNESGATLVTIDGTNYHVFGNYSFDNLPPKTTRFEPETNTIPKQTQSVKVTIEDQGKAGLNAETLKYLWIKSSVEPTIESFDTEYEVQAHKGTFTNAGTVSIDTETGDGWYLWVSAEDQMGHRYVDNAGPYYLDNTKPTVDVTNINPELKTDAEVWKNADITITVTEEHAKLLNDTIQYYLSTSENELTSEEEGSPYGEPQTLKEITLGDENATFQRTALISKLGWNSLDDTKTNETGTRYLFIKAEEDKAGNISSEYGTLVTIAEGEYAGTYHRFGPYLFDNASPQVAFNPDGSQTITTNPETKEWKQSYNDIEVEITEIGLAGLDINSFKYLWTKNSETKPTEEEFTESFTAEETEMTGEIVTKAIAHINSPEELTGYDWTLWILVKDALGEVKIVPSNPFQLDNACPVMIVTTGDKASVNEACKSTDVTIKFSDKHVGLDDENNSYQYYLSTSSTALENGEWQDYTNGGKITNLGAGITGRRYLFVKTVKDQFGFESNLSVSSNSKNTDEMTGQTISGDENSLEIDKNLGTTVIIDGVEYHRFGNVTTIDGVSYHIIGAFVFDNIAPLIEFGPDGNEIWQKEQTTVVTVAESEYEENLEETNKITASEITVDDYGKYVSNYTPANGVDVGWRIFHSDGENIYLIADDFINKQDIPAGKGGTPINNSGEYKVHFTQVRNNYKGTADILDTNPAKKWLSKFTCISDIPSWITTLTSWKTTAYLLDTNQWSIFGDSIYTEYAIGAPTIELFTESYNTINPDRTIETQIGIFNWGYQIKWSDDETFGNSIEGLNSSEELYTITDKTKAAGMWIASPSYAGHDIMMIIKDNYTGYCNTSSATSGIRPIIALKSDVEIEKQEDGTYKIVKEYVGEAGINKEATKYVWRKQSEGVPTVEEITEKLVVNETTQTVQVKVPVTKDTVTGNDWVLWVYAEDKAGNSKIASSNAFYLDNIAPTITMSSTYPENQSIEVSGTTVTKYINATFTAEDTHSGIPETSETYQYYLSSSATELIDGNWTNYPINATVKIGEGHTGTRYLFIRSIVDKAGNKSEQNGTLTTINEENYHLMGTYVFDNTVPDVTIGYDASVHQVYKQAHSVEVTIGDNTQVVPYAGINFENALVKYEWTNTRTPLTQKDQFTNTLTAETQTLIISEYTGQKYLWIYAEDNVGNYVIAYPKDETGKALPFYLDNNEPVVLTQEVIPTVSTDNNVWKSANATITFTEEHSGMEDESYEYEYYLSTSYEQLEGGTIKSYTPGTPFLIGEGITGTRYLFVRTVTDLAGNQSSRETDFPIVTIEDTSYHVFGPYKFDNIEPSVETTYSDTHNVYQKAQTVNVTLRDDNTKEPMTGEAGINLNEVRYLWTSSQTEPTKKADFPAENTMTSQKQGVTKNTETGKFYLWIYAEDKLGNNTIVGVKDEEGNMVDFWLDNTESSLQLNLTIDPITEDDVWKTADVTLTATDTDAGIDSSKTYKYHLSTSSTALENATSGTFKLPTEGEANTKTQNFTIGANVTDIRYLFVETIHDKAQNQTIKANTQITINGATRAQAIDNVTIDGVTYHVFAYDTDPYKIDNSAPEVTITTSDTGEDWKREHTATVSIVDVGLAGLDKSTSKYVWVNEENLTDAQKVLTEAAFNREWEKAEQKEKPTSEGGEGVSNVKGTFTSENVTITTPQDNLTEKISGADWYLWILAQDKLGNTAIVKSTQVHLDNEVPKFEAIPNPGGPGKTLQVKIKAVELKSGLTKDNIRQYYLSSSSSDLVGGEWKDYVSEEEFTIGEGLTGKYYIYIKQLVDKAGNVSTIAESAYKETVTIEEGENAGTYHRYGPYILDNSSPTVAVNPTTTTNANSADGKAVKTQDVTITVKDVGYAGLDDTNNTYEYYLSSSNEELSGGRWISYKDLLSAKTAGAINNTAEDQRTATITIGAGITGTRYLFIRTISDQSRKLDIELNAIDTVGNISATTGTLKTIDETTYHMFGAYVFDNSAPSVTVTPGSTINESASDGRAVLSQDITVILADVGTAGVSSTGREYYLSTSSTEITDNGAEVTAETYTSGVPFTIGAGKTGTYYIFIKQVQDRLGHLSTLNGTLTEIDGENYHRFGPYVFDNSSPTITVNPQNTTNIVADDGKAVLSQNVTITLTERGTAGLSEADGEYYLSTSETELTEVAQNYTSGTEFTIGAGKTGTYYLFVKSVSDNIGNTSNTEGTITTIAGTQYHKFGPYVFDNSEPTLTFEPEENNIWKKQHTTAVTVVDVGTAGIEQTEALYKYVWVQGATSMLDEATFNTTYDTVDAKYKGTFSNGGTITSPAGETGNDWYLCVLAKDKVGNTLIKPSKSFYLDNTRPTMQTATQYSPEAGLVKINGENVMVAEYADITLTTIDEHAKLNDASNSYQYYLSTSKNKLENGKWFDYTLTEDATLSTRTATFRIGLDDGNGKPITDDIGKGRYLFIKTIQDNAQNESNTLGEIVTIDGEKYHMFGKYVFDNDKTKITINPMENTTWKQQHTTTVTITDRGNAGVEPSSLKYLWTQDNVDLATEQAFLEAYDATIENNKGTFAVQESAQEITEEISTPAGVTGNNWKLWILAKDVLNHPTTAVSNNFYLDNTKPTISINTEYPEGAHTILEQDKDGETAGTVITKYADITLTTFDEHSKLDDAYNSYQYYLSTSSTEITGGKWMNYTPLTPEPDVVTGEQEATRTAIFTIGENDGNGNPITGVRYLFVKQIADSSADTRNLSEQYGTLEQIDNSQYQLLGRYVFDNTSPDITFNPEGNSEWAKSQATTVTVRDDNQKDPQTGVAGIDESTLKYQWIKGNEVPTEETFTQSFTNTQTLSKALDTGNDWHLWILAKDNVGNTSIVTTNPFYLDNTAPLIESMIATPSSPTTYTLTMSGVADNRHGIEPQSGVKGYILTTDPITPTEASDWTETTEGTLTYEGALELTTYYFWVIDKVGNISEVTELTTKEIFYSVNNTSWYETLTDAIAGASETETDTIYVLKNVTDLSDGIVNKNVKLDPNEKTLTREEPITVSSGASLEVIGTGTITSVNTTKPTISSEGTFKLTSATITSASASTLSADRNGTIQIAGGTSEGNIYVGNGTVDLSLGTVNGNVHGGKIQGTAETSNIILQGATVTGSIYGGGDGTDKVSQVNITLKSGTVTDVFGGGLKNSAVGTANIVLDGNITTSSGNIYGGPSTTGTVDNSNVTIKSGTITNVYGGGSQGGTTLNTVVNVEAGATIEGNVYGGAHKATVGNTANNSGSATVNIVGGTIKGNIYGGSDTDQVYGETNINIGKDAVGDSTLTSGEITIEGNIYGGGHQDNTVIENEENAGTEESQEKEIKDFTEVSVKNGTHINIDGNASTINFKGDIFGSGERTIYEGNASITIKNLGEEGKPYLFRSVQRTGTLTIDNSHLEIIGISDRNNGNVDASYTLNRIGKLNMKNGTYLYLRRGFNLVEQLNSLAEDGSKAQVTITEGAVTSKNVDNRIYVYEGVNLFIAKQEYSNKSPISEYGEVTGMTFFGMYTRDRSSNERELEYDVYDPETPEFTGTFIIDSYVEAKYDNTQAITVDGFYTNAVEDKAVANSSIITKYVTVITADSVYQDWMLGDEKVYTQEVTLVAQRNKERVYQSVPLEYLNQKGAEYEVKLFSVNSLEPDINLVSRTSIPRVARTPEMANTTFALTMKNGSGWQNSGETQFYSSGVPIQGTTTYLSDYSGNVPYIDLYLYNSINITQSKDCGFTNLVFEVTKTTNGDASEGTKFKIALSVNIQTIGEIIEGEFQTDSRITEGKNFGLITKNEIFLTDRSSMTTYFNMYPLGLYDNTEYRVLSSTCQLPIGTQITMVDYGEDENHPKVYYYEVKEGDGTYEEETGRYIYNFSDFILMSSVTEGEGVTAEEAEAAHFKNNNLAYSESGFEEYKILIDFKKATIAEDLLEQNIAFELRDSTGTMKNYEILPTQFNIYANKRSELSLDVTKDVANVYDMIENGELNFTVKSIMTTQSVSITSTVVDKDGNETQETVIHPIEDTYYKEKKLGMAISLYDFEGNKVPYEKVKGIYYVVDGQEYYPDLTGTARWYLADNVVTVEKQVKMYIEGGLLDSGTYQIRIENFASDNGTYFGAEGDNQDNTTINMIDLEHGLQVDISEEDKVIDATTGKTYDGDTQMDINITASDIVKDTNIRVSLYKRDITYNNELTYAGISYTLVDLASYVSNTLQKPENPSNNYEYLITDEVEEQTIENLLLNLKSNLLTGGYKLEFSIYSGDNYLGKVDRHFVVTDLVTVE